LLRKSASYCPRSAKMAAPKTKPLELLLTVTPMALTSLGSRPDAWFTRFCTSTAARSGSRSGSNVTTIVLVPSLPLVDCT
jgi:hypothetical protein